VLGQDTSARQAREQLTETGLPGAPVTDEGQIFRGSVDLERVVEADSGQPVGSLINRSISAVPSDATLDAVVEIFATERVAWVPILDADRHVVGVVGTGDLIAAYRHSLRSSLQSLHSIFGASVFAEHEVRPESTAIGRTVSDAGWPNGTVVVAMQRGNQLIFPEPSTEIHKGDVVSALVPGNAQEGFREVLGDYSAAEEEEDEEPMI
jgi:hypothetical protein